MSAGRVRIADDEATRFGCRHGASAEIQQKWPLRYSVRDAGRESVIEGVQEIEWNTLHTKLTDEFYEKTVVPDSLGQADFSERLWT